MTPLRAENAATRLVAHNMIDYRRKIDALLIECGFDPRKLPDCALSDSEVDVLFEGAEPRAVLAFGGQ